MGKLGNVKNYKSDNRRIVNANPNRKLIMTIDLNYYMKKDCKLL
jgi:hypothetical protein